MILRDNYERTTHHAAPEWGDVMKAQKVVLAVTVVGLLALGFGVWALFTFVPAGILWAILGFLGVAGFVIFMFMWGIEWIIDGVSWVGDQFSTLSDAKNYGVHDE
jgi:peptidoglycan biosynthesis protein MviN/MurJ (putative lipid II flippase)